jgi:putative tricarboxylic transport membrane protein
VRVNDTVIGAVLLALSLAVLWHVKDFPTIPGQPYGAALYPTVVSAGLAIASVLLLLQGLRSGEPMFGVQASSRRGLLAFAVTLGSLFFYVFAVDALGFVVCAALMLAALMWSYGVRPSRIVPVAIVATLVIHTGFYKLLKVPLPWGLLQPIAW